MVPLDSHVLSNGLVCTLAMASSTELHWVIPKHSLACNEGLRGLLTSHLSFGVLKCPSNVGNKSQGVGWTKKDRFPHARQA